MSVLLSAGATEPQHMILVATVSVHREKMLLALGIFIVLKHD